MAALFLYSHGLIEKLQNVMAVTEVLALCWQSPHNEKRGTAMKKTAAILVLWPSH
jgi:hypothetical protein